MKPHAKRACAASDHDLRLPGGRKVGIHKTECRQRTKNSVRHMRTLALSLLSAACLLGGLAQAQTRPGFYVEKTLPDGTRYLGSDIATPENAVDPSVYQLEQDVSIGQTEMIHFPSGMHFPRQTSSCTLQAFGGIERGAPAQHFMMKYGARGFYTCDPSAGLAFLLYATETEVLNPFEMTPSLVPWASSIFMNSRPDPKNLTCETPIVGDITQQWCRNTAVVNGIEIIEFGVVAVKGDSYFRANAAALPEQYEAAKRGLAQWLLDIGIQHLDQDRPSRR